MSDERTRKVLIADDDEDQRYVLGRIFQRAGFVTVMVELGADVVPKALAEEPDVILLDVQMPDQDGFTTGRQLKAEPVLADVPIIFLSGRTDARDREEGLALGGDAFLPKSTDHGELVRRVTALANLNPHS
jgi:DNA-binding response OmpR family regulator